MQAYDSGPDRPHFRILSCSVQAGEYDMADRHGLVNPIFNSVSRSASAMRGLWHVSLSALRALTGRGIAPAPAVEAAPAKAYLMALVNGWAPPDLRITGTHAGMRGPLSSLA